MAFIEAYSAVRDDVAGDLADTVGKTWPDPTAGAASVTVGQVFFAIAPAGSTSPADGNRAVAGERRTYRKTGASAWVDLGDKAAQLSYATASALPISTAQQAALDGIDDLTGALRRPTMPASVAGGNAVPYLAALAADTSLAGNGQRIPKGVWEIGEGQVIPHDDFTLEFERGSVFKQPNNTQTMDTMVTLTGNRGRLEGAVIDGNRDGNPNYLGRGEGIRIVGDDCSAKDAIIRNTGVQRLVGGVLQENALSNGLFVVGNRFSSSGLRSYNAGYAAVRVNGSGCRFYDSEFIDFVVKGLVMDNFTGVAAQSLEVDGLRAISSSPDAREGFMVDSDGKPLGLCRLRNAWIETPNSRHANNIKFAYTTRVEIDGLRSIMGGLYKRVWAAGLGVVTGDYVNTGQNIYTAETSGNAGATMPTHTAGVASDGGVQWRWIAQYFGCSLRFQEAVERVRVSNAVLDGHINFDATVACEFDLTGASVVCDALQVPVAIQQFWGNARIGDGVSLRNATDYWISFDGQREAAALSKATLGAVDLRAPAGYTPTLVQPVNQLFTSPSRYRPVAGNLKIGDVAGNYVRGNGSKFGSIAYDATVLSAAGDGYRVFVWEGTGRILPGASDGWQVGDIIISPAAGDYKSPSARCTVAGTAENNAWAGNTDFALGNRVYNGGNVYRVTAIGKSALTGGPTGTGDAIVDGTVTWAYVASRAVFEYTRPAKTAFSYIGDADRTYTPSSDGITEEFYYSAALTANRTLRLMNDGAQIGQIAEATRFDSATGAFNLTLQDDAGASIITLDGAGQWAKLRFDGSNWKIAAAGNDYPVNKRDVTIAYPGETIAANSSGAAYSFTLNALQRDAPVASLSVDNQGSIAVVRMQNTSSGTVRLFNPTSSPITIAAGTIYVTGKRTR